MLLRHVRLAEDNSLKNIRIDRDRIKDLQTIDGPVPEADPVSAPQVLSFDGAMAFPGLINSHDHLDFNLFPMLGNRIYQDYTEWGKDIHFQNKTEIGRVLKVPRLLRTRWGLYKNLLNGFTTVVNHGAQLDMGTEELITVFQDCRCLHSLSAEKYWKWKVNSRWAGNKLIAIHIGEGTNEAAGREIDRLRRWNLFGRGIVGIHGVAMEERQAAAFRGLVWCPGSNYFLLDRTARIGLLKKKVPILFGTDSTLSAGWNSWDQLRLARKEGVMTDQELMDTVTRTPAAVWGLPHLGKIAEGYQADLVIANAKKTGMNALYALNPEDILLVLHRGEIRLFDASLLGQLQAAGYKKEAFSTIIVGKNHKYVQGNLPGLMKDILKFYPEAVFPVTANLYTNKPV